MGGSVMGGAGSWPALSESTRPVMRSSSDSLIPNSGGSPSSSQVSMISHRPRRQSDANINPSTNNASRPRSRNRGGGVGGGTSSGGGPSHNMFTQPFSPMPPPFPNFEPYGMVPPVLDSPMISSRPIGGVGVSRMHMDNNYSFQRNNSRRSNYGFRPRGDGPHRNNHRRDVQQLPPPYMHAPIRYMPSPLLHGASPFAAPPPVRPFPWQGGFDMAYPVFFVPTMPPDPYRGMSFVPPPPPPPMPFPLASDNSLANDIVSQIDYYFSDDNLAKDNFLRSNMDDNGWVPITLIASFRLVQMLTNDIPVILDSLRFSTVVEVQGDRVRRRNEWSKWIRSSGQTSSADSSPQIRGAALETDILQSLQGMSLDDSMASANGNVEGHTEMAIGAHLFEDSTSLSRLAY